MPVYEVEAPDGRLIEVEGDRMPNEQELQQIFASVTRPSQDAQGEPQLSMYEQPQQRPQKPDPSFTDKAIGAGEAALTTLTGATAGTAGSLIGTLEGIVQAARDGKIGEPEAAQIIQQRAAELGGYGTYQPRTQQGQEYVQTIAEAAGALPPVIGGAVPARAVGEVVDVAARLSTPVAASKAVEFAKANKLPLMTSDVVPPESALGRGIRNIGEEIPVAGTSGMRDTQQKSRIAQIESLKELYPEVTDDAIYKSFVESGNKYKKAVSDRYTAIGNAMGDTEVQIPKTANTIYSELQELKAAGRVQDTETINSLQKVLDDLLSGPQTYKSMRDNRTFVREALKSENPSTQADRVIDRVYASMTDDISDAVLKTAGPESAAKLKQVDQLFAAEKNTQKKTKLRNILAKGDVKPEEATKAIFSSDLSDVKQSYASLDNKGRSIARAAIVNKILDKAGESPEKFLSAMNQYDKQYGVFFKGAERKQLDGLRAYLDATRRASKANLDTETGKKLIPFLVAGGVGADIQGGGGAATATFATIGALSRAYESKPVRAAMIRLANTPKGGEAYQKAVNSVNAAFVAAQQQQREE